MKLTLEEKLIIFKEYGYKYNYITGDIISKYGKIIKGKSNNYIIIRLVKFKLIVPSEIDHINRIKYDNRIENLRILKHNENGWNNSAVGYTKNKRDNNFTAQIVVNYKRKFLGNFKTEEEAHKAYLDAKKIYHKIGNN